MSTVISVLTTKDGQGSSGFALSLAWTAAERGRVILVDADMSGTGTLADTLALDFGTQGIGNLFGTRAISSLMLEQQAVQVRTRPRLRVVAGLQGYSGPGVADFLPRLVPALHSVPDDLVVLDLGAALAHPGQESSRRTAEAIGQASQRVFIVMHDSPPRLVKSIQVLKAAQLPQAELVVYETRRGALRDQVRRALAEHLPGVRLTAHLPWDERRAARAEDAAVPVTIPGLLRSLQVAPPGPADGRGLTMPVEPPSFREPG
jgi:MinD-like ATPase involved in chromosome partitioning or flagellar assembly